MGRFRGRPEIHLATRVITGESSETMVSRFDSDGAARVDLPSPDRVFAGAG